MHKSATKCNETVGKWCKNKHGASKIIDTFETYQRPTTDNLYRQASATKVPLILFSVEQASGVFRSDWGHIGWHRYCGKQLFDCSSSWIARFGAHVLQIFV
jgi:hypothetical protein